MPGTLKDGPTCWPAYSSNKSDTQPTVIITDAESYSDQLFGLFWLLGYQFIPRLADVGDARLLRLDRSADYGLVNRLARNRINRELIARNWDDMLRAAGSLKMGMVGAVELIRSLQGGSRASRLGQALAELGRIPETVHLLTFFDDEEHRRFIGR